MKKFLIKTFFILLFINSISYANPVKITLIERVTQFIEWPYLGQNFKIAVYQNEDIVYIMEEMLENNLIHKRPVKIFNIQNENDINLNKINLIYFTKESSGEIDKLINKIKNLPILIITDYPNDVYNNMHLGIYFQNRKIKFIINKEAMDKAQLKTSYKLLQLAKIVKKGEQ